MHSKRIKAVLDYCKKRPYVRYEHKAEWEADIMTVGGKIFAMIGEYKDKRPIITLKSDPSCALELRDAYEGVIIPGYYSNKKHWNSIFLDRDIEPEKLIYELIDASYTLVFQGLPTKERAALKNREQP